MRVLLICVGLVGALQVIPPRPKGLFLEPAKDTAEITKPALDRKTYAFKTLPNGLRTLVVQDPDATKAGVAVAVDAGSYSDGLDYPGLAHFCEHMLFLGNEKYPTQGDFDNFLSQHDGMSNAYTDQEMTVYFNEVGMTGFDGTMDRFAQFFIAPLFNRSMARKEIQAVDSEHQKNLPDAFRRTWEVMRSLANPESPVSRFYTGDIHTLLTDESGNKVVDALKKYHGENYCAGRERLVIVANMSTAELMAKAEEHFAGLPKGHCVEHKEFDGVDPWKGRLGQMLHMGTRGTAQLWTMFALPPTKPHYKAQPAAYLQYLFSDATEGSLRATLKAQNLANGVSSWTSDTSAAAMLWLVFDLTDEGVKNYPKVLEHLTAYTETVRAKGVDMSVYTSLADLAKVHFDYQDPADSSMSQVSNLAASLTSYGPEDVLTSSYLITDPDAKVVAEFLDHLRTDQMNAALATPAFTTPEEEKAALEKRFPGVKATVGEEQYYHVPYVQTELAAELGAKLTKPFDGEEKPAFAVPGALVHVPSELEVITDTSGEHPKRLPSTRSELWWKGMGVHKLPKAEVLVKLAFGKEVADVELAALGLLHAELVRDSLEADVDELLSSGVGYSFNKEGDGFTLRFYGYDQHLEVLMQKVLEKVWEPTVSDFIFERIRQAKVHHFQDVTSAQAFEHASEFYSVAMDSDSYSRLEYLQVLQAKETNAARVKEVVKKAMSKSRLTMLFVGNIPSKRAETMASLVENAVLQGDALTEEQEFEASVVHPHDETMVRVRNPIPQDPNHATVNVYQWPEPPTIAQRVNLMLLGQMLHRKAFDELRTTRQLGYVVSAGVVPHGPIGELRVLVQGTKATPDTVDGYIETMLSHFGSDLAEMSDEEFENRKEGVRVQLSKHDQTLSAEAGRYWHVIRDRSYCFSKKELSLEALENLKDREPLVKFWKDLTHTKRTKVSVQVFGTGVGMNTTDVPPGAVELLADTLRAKNPEYYPNDRLCPDKVLFLSQIAMIAA
jgi:insulysin